MITDLRTPLPSIARASQEERSHIAMQTLRERAWYQDYPRFETNEDILKAAATGALEHVAGDENIVPIARMRSPELAHLFPPYLLPESLHVFQAIGRLWRKELAEHAPPAPEVRLATTSLARSEIMQDELLARPEKLASPGSTHTAAAAFDLDASGYYVLNRRSKLTAVAHPDRSLRTVKRINHRLMKVVAEPFSYPVAEVDYDPRVPEALLEVTGFLHRAGIVNAIVEYEGTSNQCVHIAPNPEAIHSIEG